MTLSLNNTVASCEFSIIIYVAMYQHVGVRPIWQQNYKMQEELSIIG